jgi:hypothetical protein
VIRQNPSTCRVEALGQRRGPARQRPSVSPLLERHQQPATADREQDNTNINPWLGVHRRMVTCVIAIHRRRLLGSLVADATAHGHGVILAVSHRQCRQPPGWTATAPGRARSENEQWKFLRRSRPAFTTAWRRMRRFPPQCQVQKEWPPLTFPPKKRAAG